MRLRTGERVSHGGAVRPKINALPWPQLENRAAEGMSGLSVVLAVADDHGGDHDGGDDERTGERGQDEAQAPFPGEPRWGLWGRVRGDQSSWYRCRPQAIRSSQLPSQKLLSEKLPLLTVPR